MLKLKTPNGLEVEVAETPAEEASSRFTIEQADEIREYYDAHGYVVVSGVFPRSMTRKARELWENEIKPYSGKIYRQTSSELETHRLDHHGWVMNPILNLQSLDPSRFPELRHFARNTLMTHASFVEALRVLLGDDPKFVQSMYFEGNSETVEHRDSPYLDSEHLGSIVGSWIALEDIRPRAGRFFVVPGSHKLDVSPTEEAKDAIASEAEYIQKLVAHIKSEQRPIHAPALREGDLLMWNGFTIHGSLASSDPDHARNSITAHAIPAKHKFAQFHTRVMDVPTERVDDVLIYAPKDLALRRNRILRSAEARFPTAFHALKGAVKSTLLKLNRNR